MTTLDKQPENVSSSAAIPSTHLTGRILVVDDEESVCVVLNQILVKEGYEVAVASTGNEALRLFQDQPFNVVIQDIKLPDVDGLNLIRKYKEINPEVMIIIITAFSTTQIAVEAMRLGAYDYLCKPLENNESLLITVHRALQSQLILKTFKAHEEQKPSFRTFIGKNEKMQQVYHLIQQVAPTDSPVLIQGENGTGKELVARSLHYSSPRIYYPFITVNCGAFPENLLESELFGHLKGSFTTALYDKKGLLEVADKGTFFLDEVSELTPAMQVKLLRVIEEKEFRPVGSNETKRVDVRFIAATNTDLKKQVSDGEFREDLFYRLNVITIDLPPLRERRDDIPLLSGHFLAKSSRSLKKTVTGFTPAALELLTNYDWPGNVRELENVIQRAVILAKEKETSIQVDNLTPIIGGPAIATTLSPEGVDLENKVKIMEMDYLHQALKSTGGNLTEAARLLNLSPRSLRYKIKKYGLTKPKF